jgi:hypothetical protein
MDRGSVVAFGDGNSGETRHIVPSADELDFIAQILPNVGGTPSSELSPRSHASGDRGATSRATSAGAVGGETAP